jgi:hypothetical protein
MDEAIDSICDVIARYGHHCRAARQVAEEYFDSDKVLARLVDTATASASDEAKAAVTTSDSRAVSAGRPSADDDTRHA